MTFKDRLASQPFWYWAFVLLLVLLPLPFGTNRPWSADLLGVLSGLLLLAMLWERRDAPSWAGDPPRKRLALAAIGVTGVVVWSFFQGVSWTPAAWHHPIWAEAEKLLGPVNGAISVNPGLFTESLVRFLSFIAFFLLAFFAGRDRDRAALLLRFLAWAGAVYAFYGLIVQSLGSETILWYKKWAYYGFLTSTFVNKNSYATYAGLGLLCAFAAAWQQIRHLKIKDAVLARSSRAAALFASLEVRHYLLFAPILLLLGALALTGSRGGVASSLLGAFVLLLTMAVNRRWSLRRWGILAGGGLVLFALLTDMGGHALIQRMQSDRLDEDASTRLAAYALTENAIADNPWLGFGLGSFDSAFRLYRDASLSLWFQHAHNDYLELAMDLGLPVAGLFLFSLALLLSCCLSGVWKRRRDAIYPCVAVGATVLVGTHVMVDFSLQIPAVAATYAALLGTGVAQSFSSKEEKDEGAVAVKVKIKEQTSPPVRKTLPPTPSSKKKRARKA